LVAVGFAISYLHRKGAFALDSVSTYYPTVNA
jgi:hypothetical protein